MPDKVHPMDALTATKPGVFVLDIKTIPALSHITNQPRHKFLNLLLEITRLFTLWSRAFRLGFADSEAPSSNRTCGFPAYGFPCETVVIGSISFS